jgi:tetratricopeptide (TPR) repeat protein
MGDALLGLGRLDEAASAYERSRGLRRQLDQEYLAVEPVAGLACVFLRQDNLTEALELVEEILDQMAPATRDAEMPQACERVWQALEGVDEPFWVYLTCYRVLQAASDPRAHGLLLFAHGLLLEHSNRVEDHDLRRSFFENVPAHRDLVRVWEQRGSQA